MKRERNELKKGVAEPIYNRPQKGDKTELWQVACNSSDCDNSYRWRIVIGDNFPLIKAYRKEWRHVRVKRDVKWYCEQCRYEKRLHKAEPVPEYVNTHKPVPMLSYIVGYDPSTATREGIPNKKRKVKEMAFIAPKPVVAKTINPRTKGRMGECEVRDKFRLVMLNVEKSLDFPETKRLSTHVKRASHSAADNGGCDLLGIPMLSVEVKRRETLNLNQWWKQTCDQRLPNTMPVLFWRQNRAPWRVRSYTLLYNGEANAPSKWVVADFDMEAFFEWFEQYYTSYLQKYDA